VIGTAADESVGTQRSLLLRLACGAGLGLILFVLHQLGAISGALAPPRGYEPAWAVRNLDIPQYITWLTAGRSHVLLPDYHAPWITEPALFQPLFLLAGRIPLTPLAAYQLASLLLYMAAGAALIYANSVFCPRLERYALLASACALPFPLLGLAIGKVLHSTVLSLFGIEGMLDYSYETADGLFRGGLSGTLTLSTGTASVLLCMAMLARHVQTGERRYAQALVALTFLSALLHPFEVLLIAAASAVPLLLAHRVRVWIAVCVAGLAGMSPYLVLSARSQWVRDLGEQIQHPVHPFSVLVNFGPTVVLAVYFLLIRFRMPRPEDHVLQSWFLAAIALGNVPGVPFAPHLFNGFAYCAGFLLVRRLAVDRQIVPLLQRHRRLATTAMAGVAALSAASCFLLYQQIWNDGRRADPEWLLSAVRPVSEAPVLSWLRSHVASDSLVLSPGELAPWIAAIPLPSFASQDFSSITYSEQHRLAEAFYRGDDVQRDLIEAYGVRIAVVPDSSSALQRLHGAVLRESIGPWRIYEFPDARMKPYPGLAALDPWHQISIRTRLLRWLAHAL
jgi:hypothetical protein